MLFGHLRGIRDEAEIFAKALKNVKSHMYSLDRFEPHHPKSFHHEIQKVATALDGIIEEVATGRFPAVQSRIVMYDLFDLNSVLVEKVLPWLKKIGRG